MIRVLARYLAYDFATKSLRVWISKVVVAENGVTVVSDLSGWEQ